MVEQEAMVLRTKLQKLEGENEKLQTENKKLSVQAVRGAKKELDKSSSSVDVNKLKEELKLMELDREELKEKLKTFMEASIRKLPDRSPKKYSESLTKSQIKVCNQISNPPNPEISQSFLFPENDRGAGIRSRRSSSSGR